MPSSISPMTSQTHVVASSTVFPDQHSTLGDLQLSVSDLPMLSCHYIQKGLLFPLPPFPLHQSIIPLLKTALSQTLSRFPPLAGRLTTYSTGHVYISCNDGGVDFIHASAPTLSARDVLVPTHVPQCVKDFFAYHGTVSYTGHHKPILAIQITELNDALFIGCAVNHAVTDGTSFWNFFNTFAELSRSLTENHNYAKTLVTRQPEFSRDSVLISPAVLRFPEGGPKVTFSLTEPLSERIFSFNREAIQRLKARTNNKKFSEFQNDDALISAIEILGKHSNDPYQMTNSNGVRVTSIIENWFKTSNSNAKNTTPEISSFQSLCALLWRSVTRARKLPVSKMTTFRMAVNCRQRLEPKLDAYYFGNAIQSIPTYATAGEVLSHDTRWCAEQLNKNVKAHDNDKVRGVVKDWERDPRVFPLGNPDGAMMTMGSSPRFPMYDNDFGWGRPMAIRSGRANKFDGKMSAFPGREGGGSVDLEVILAPDTMALLEIDSEFMQYVSN